MIFIFVFILYSSQLHSHRDRARKHQYSVRSFHVREQNNNDYIIATTNRVIKHEINQAYQLPKQSFPNLKEGRCDGLLVGSTEADLCRRK